MVGERHLRDEAHRVDRVRREERTAPLQGGVGQGALHERLAIVERTVDREGHDTGAGPRDLGFLDRADAHPRVEHHGAHAGDAGAGLGHRGAGVARGRGEHGQLREVVSQHAGGDAHQGAHREVLEGRGGPMEQFQHADPAGGVAREGQRHREIERLAAHRAQDVGPEFVGEIGGHHGLGQGSVIGVAVRRQEVIRQRWDRGRDPESALGRHRREQDLAQAAPAGGVGGGDELELRRAR